MNLVLETVLTWWDEACRKAALSMFSMNPKGLSAGFLADLPFLHLLTEGVDCLNLLAFVCIPTVWRDKVHQIGSETCPQGMMYGWVWRCFWIWMFQRLKVNMLKLWFCDVNDVCKLGDMHMSLYQSIEYAL